MHTKISPFFLLHVYQVVIPKQTTERMDIDIRKAGKWSVEVVAAGKSGHVTITVESSSLLISE